MRAINFVSMALSAGLAAMLPQFASACSCMGIDYAGFVHAKVKRLPSNAKGALFLPPAGSMQLLRRLDADVRIYRGTPEPLKAESFQITSDTDSGALQAVFSFPDLTREGSSTARSRSYRYARAEDEAGVRNLKRGDIERLVLAGVLLDITGARDSASRLTRVAPEGGFKPGLRYTITYVGPARRWKFPSTVEHTIDATPLDTVGGAYSLVLDGPPGRKLLELPSVSGSCSNDEPALVQDFHYRLPSSHQPYRDAMVFYTEVKPSDPASGKGHEYTLTDYSPSICGSSHFASTAYGQGKDMVYAQCGENPRPVSVRGWAGMLEVEDRLHLAAPVDIDLGPAAQANCVSVDSKLAAALASGDEVRVKRAVCAFAEGRREGDFLEGPERYGPQFPTSSLLALAPTSDAALGACLETALMKVLGEADAPSGQHLDRYADTFKAELLSGDVIRIKRAASALGDFVHRSRSSEDQGAARIQRVLTRVLGPMVTVLTAGPNKAAGFMPTLIAEVKKPAQQYVPALISAARAYPAGWTELVLTLEKIAPDDPRFHKLLLDSMTQAALADWSSMVYSRVAGKRNEAKAINLLIEQGTWGGPRALGRLANLLDAPPPNAPDARLYRGLPDLGKHGRQLLPSFERLMGKPMTALMKSIIEQSIAEIGLPSDQLTALRAQLDQVRVIDEKR